MSRRILRLDRGVVSVAAERRFESEARLHDAIATHPEVLPTEDLNLGPLVALAQELDLGGGPMDLLAVDPQGRLVIVEFKRGSENPDVRKVVAQLLDYGSSLWQLSYDDLEDAVRRQARDQNWSLVDTVETRCLELGAPFESEAFVSGVSGSLEQGTFVFLFVARDFDERTRRVMTYLADGARMTFFAVEVDYFVEAESASAVLVPRTAFVPSWIATGETPVSRGSRTPAFDIATADPAVKTLIERMDEVAADLGLRAAWTRAGRTYTPHTRELGATYSMGLGVYGSSRAAQFNIGIFREFGREDVADDLLERLRRITGERVTAAWPAIAADALVRDWAKTRDEVIVPYFQARTALAHEGSGTAGAEDTTSPPP